MKLFWKKDKKDIEALRKELNNRLSEFLMDLGFSIEDSYKMAEDFWKRNWKKVEEVISS
ncbi:MAG: hypothetical protein QXL51_01455 [Candidatus Aenigmatarchaeota archaeon]